jgi:hypothetical protein
VLRAAEAGPGATSADWPRPPVFRGHTLHALLTRLVGGLTGSPRPRKVRATMMSDFREGHLRRRSRRGNSVCSRNRRSPVLSRSASALGSAGIAPPRRPRAILASRRTHRARARRRTGNVSRSADVTLPLVTRTEHCAVWIDLRFGSAGEGSSAVVVPDGCRHQNLQPSVMRGPSRGRLAGS